MKQYISLLCLFLTISSKGMNLGTNIQELPQDLSTEIMSYLDVPSAYAFFLTCKTNVSWMKFSNKNHMEWFLDNNPQRYSELPITAYVNTLVEASQQHDDKKVSTIISYESKTQYEERQKIFRLFDYSAATTITPAEITVTKQAFTGIFNPTKKLPRRKQILAITKALLHDQAHAITVLVKNKIHLNTLFKTGQRGYITYLSWAATRNKPAILEALHQADANFNLLGHKGNTLMHVLTSKKIEPEIVILLIQYGANVNQPNNHDIYPLDVKQSKKIRNILITNGAINGPNHRHTPEQGKQHYTNKSSQRKQPQRQQYKQQGSYLRQSHG